MVAIWAFWLTDPAWPLPAAARKVAARVGDSAALAATVGDSAALTPVPAVAARLTGTVGDS